jgi:tetratricopeptide (TPR) repeat protein
MNLANVLAGGGAFEQAVAAYDQALGIRPGWGEALHNKAMVLWRLNRPGEALETFQAAQSAMPESPKIQVGMASLLVSLNRLDEAVTHYERALALPDPPNPADLHNDAGIVLARLGRFPAAIAHFEAALRLRPDFAAAAANLARAKRGGR